MIQAHTQKGRRPTMSDDKYDHNLFHGYVLGRAWSGFIRHDDGASTPLRLIGDGHDPRPMNDLTAALSLHGVLRETLAEFTETHREDLAAIAKDLSTDTSTRVTYFQLGVELTDYRNPDDRAITDNLTADLASRWAQLKAALPHPEIEYEHVTDERGRHIIVPHIRDRRPHS